MFRDKRTHHMQTGARGALRHSEQDKRDLLFIKVGMMVPYITQSFSHGVRTVQLPTHL